MLYYHPHLQRKHHSRCNCKKRAPGDLRYVPGGYSNSLCSLSLFGKSESGGTDLNGAVYPRDVSLSGGWASGRLLASRSEPRLRVVP
jgi:hypothetical protein